MQSVHITLLAVFTAQSVNLCLADRQAISFHSLEASDGKLLGQCPKNSVGQDIDGASCDTDKVLKCCNHRCRLRSQVTPAGSMSSLPRPVTQSQLWKILSMGKRPAEACCREIIVMDADKQWECRTNELNYNEILQQMTRGPMEHRRDMLGKALIGFYNGGLKPLEDDYYFSHFYQSHFTFGEAMAKPLVMTLGGYSTGKTTFIKSLIGTDYKGMRIGPEPTTDRFTVIEYGEEKSIIPGDVVAVDQDLMFTSLDRLGSSFLRNFDMATAPSEILRSVSILDTPGVLAGDKQNSREYDYNKAVQWFAKRADMILLFFDVQKIDIWDELKEVIQQLGENMGKVRIVLNRADSLEPEKLMSVYGGLMWGLSDVFNTPEVKPIYIGSFNDEEYDEVSQRMHYLFDESKDKLMEEILDLSKESAISKVGTFIRRAKLAKAHAMLLTHLRDKMPWFWGANKQQAKLIDELPEVYRDVAAQNDLPVGDLPAYEEMQRKLETISFKDIRTLSKRKMSYIDDILSVKIKDLTAALRAGFIRQANNASEWTQTESDEDSGVAGFELGTRECVGRDVELHVDHHSGLSECEVSGSKGRVCAVMTPGTQRPPGFEQIVPRAECCGGLATLVDDPKIRGASFYKCHGAEEGSECAKRKKAARGWHRKYELGSVCGTGLSCSDTGCKKDWW